MLFLAKYLFMNYYYRTLLISYKGWLGTSRLRSHALLQCLILMICSNIGRNASILFHPIVHTVRHSLRRFKMDAITIIHITPTSLYFFCYDLNCYYSFDLQALYLQPITLTHSVCNLFIYTMYFEKFVFLKSSCSLRLPVTIPATSPPGGR